MDDEAEIRRLIEGWAVWRDAGDWDRVRTVYHDDGRMMTTWVQATADEFIKASREGFALGVRIGHFLGGTVVDIEGDRAIGQTKMTITQRSDVDGVACDVQCTGRFYDFFERRAGRWGIVLRQPVYEFDRIHVLDPSASLNLDQDLLSSFPIGYCHLAYLQTKAGMTVKTDMPGLTGPEVESLYASGKLWLTGEPLDR